MNIQDKIQNVKNEINNYAAAIDMKYVNARIEQMIRIDPYHRDNVLYNYIFPCGDLGIDVTNTSYISLDQDEYTKERIMIHNTTDDINYDLIAHDQYEQGVEEYLYNPANVILRYTNTSSYISLNIHKKIDDIQTMNIISKFTNPYISTIYHRSCIGKIMNPWPPFNNNKLVSGIIDNFYKWFKACMLCYDESFETFMYDISKYLLETYRILDNRQYDINSFEEVLPRDYNFKPVNIDISDIVLTYMAYNYNNSQLVNNNQLMLNPRYLVGNSKILNFPGFLKEMSKMADKQYSILHEIGDYFRANPVSENDNKIINEQLKDINNKEIKKEKDNNK